VVLQVGVSGRGGDMFELDMGKPIKIMDHARRRGMAQHIVTVIRHNLSKFQPYFPGLLNHV